MSDDRTNSGVDVAPTLRMNTKEIAEALEEVEVVDVAEGKGGARNGHTARTVPPDGEDVSFEDESSSPAAMAAPAPKAETPKGDLPPMRPRAPSVQGLPPAPPPPKRATVPDVGVLRPASKPAPAAPVAASEETPALRPSTLVIVPPHLGVTPPPPDPSVRRKARPWFEDLFNDDFLRTGAPITREQIGREVDFVEESLGIAKGGSILDVGCGTGQHAIELSRRGYEVVGLDLSLAMLARASDDAQDEGQHINFVQGDMREITFEDAFDGIFCWNTSFGFFEDDKNQHVVWRIHRALKKGGQFLLDVINRDFMVKQAPSLAWFEGDGCVCMDEMSMEWLTSRMRVKRTMMIEDGRSREIEYSIRVYSVHELGKMLNDVGFRVSEVSGRVATPGVFFGTESPRTLILAEKR